MVHKILARVVLGLAVGAGAVSGQPQPRAFFKNQARLSESEIQKIEQGQVMTKVLGSTDKYGMLVFGAVYINRDVKKLAVLRQRVLDGMTTYLSGGLKAFGSYRDREKSLNPYQATRDIVVNSSYYLTKYPDGKVATGKGVESTKDTLSMFVNKAERQVTGESQ